MLRTVSIPVDLPKARFFALQAQCAEIFNAHIDWALKEKTYNKSKAHQALYSQLRLTYPDVPSALLQATRDNALEAIKQIKFNNSIGYARETRAPLSFKRTPRKKPTSGLRYDKRTMTLRGEQLTLSCIGKRVKLILNIPNYFREIYDNWDFRGATVTYTKQTKQFWVRLVFEHPDPEKLEHGDVQGIDRGLYHLCSTHDGQFFSSNKIRATQRKYLYNRRKLQQKGTRSAKRRLKAMSGCEKRFMRDRNHCVSKQLANQAEYSIFALEDLSGIRNQRRGKKLNKWLSSWSFAQLEFFLGYKSIALGKETAFVDARYTSQRCSRCGNVNKTNRKKSKFHCRSCHFEAHSDINSGHNIRDNYFLSLSSTARSEEQAVVNQPDVTA
jgi:putative transposase